MSFWSCFIEEQKSACYNRTFVSDLLQIGVKTVYLNQHSGWSVNRKYQCA